jgi:hypothetical protein
MTPAGLGFFIRSYQPLRVVLERANSITPEKTWNAPDLCEVFLV